ncbi:MAG: PhoX family protein [Burkholderiales bacterium]|nr:PhoX family phosphatase [Nitrosomonadaceae bacterium]
MSYDKSAEDVVTNLSNNPSIYDVVDTALENPVRRRLIAAGASGAAALSFLSLTGCGDSNSSNPAPTTPASTPTTPPVGKATALGFSAVPKSLADVVSVPAGYQVSVLFRLGDPMTASTPEYLNDGTDSGASFANRAGDHHDGMHFFGMNAAGAYDPNASDRGLLCMNHEAITPAFLHPNGPTIVNGARTVNEEVIKELNVHGVSVIEVRRTGNSWSYVRNSTFNRRITTNTDMILSGPAARSPQMITQYSPDGSRTRGTVNNCAHGYTPWGTYLTCEENYAGYFRRVAAVDNPNRTPKELVSFARNGVTGNGREGWATAVAADPTDTTFSRWITEKRGASADGRDDFRNVSNTYGWNVEIDPFNPSSTPKKRTAMGRFAHEGAWPARVVAGQPLVWYMGDDSRGEYIYKYVSNAVWDPADATRGMAAGDKYLDDGKLYVARFNADGLGEWLELRLGVGNITSANTTYAFESQADVLINTRLAADALGATRMDRPEWGAVDPFNGNVYMTLTNNNSTIRTLANADAANPRFYNDPRTTGTAQRGNPNGHIIRWAEINSNPAAVAFSWDIFLFGSRSTSDTRTVNLSNLSAANDFSSPDGIWFGKNGILWIQTDDGAYTDVSNCMMLAAIPGAVRDGGPVIVPNTDGTTTRNVTTYVGAQLGETRLRRFMVGPKECEITGIIETPDGRTLFVNIQHPGEDTTPNFTTRTYGSNWPDGGNARPRSATIVVTRTDGGVIGV